MDEIAQPQPEPDDVLAAIEHTLDNATFKLGRLRHRNRGQAIARDLTSVFYDISAARHDIARLREELGTHGGGTPQTAAGERAGQDVRRQTSDGTVQDPTGE